MKKVAIGAGLLASVVGCAMGATVTVTTGSNVTDIDFFTGTIADLPGPDGKVSMAEAMIATNNTPGHDRIEFAIPQNEWLMQWLYPGRAVLVQGNFRANDSVEIDATTQTAFTGDTYAGGNEVAIYGSTIYLNADNSSICGFDGIPLQVSGDNSHVFDNTGNTNITLFDSHGTLVENNIAGTIKIDRCNNCVVVGNVTTRVRVQGWVSEFGTGPASNNRIGGPTLAERNYITGYGTHSGEGFPSGTTVEIFDNDGTIVENNWIGTLPDGVTSGSTASTQGVGFTGTNTNVTIRNNQIAGILGIGIGPHYVGYLVGWGVYVTGTGSNITIENNTIGLDANGDPLGSVFGIEVADYFAGPVDGVTISGNEIAGHLISGVYVRTGVNGVDIMGNSIHDNADLGIDLYEGPSGIGVTANDALDVDTGANGLQNFPVLVDAYGTPASVQIVGTLNSMADSSYRVEFFASSACDPSGHGEGERFLGSAVVLTNGSGDAVFDVTLPASVAAGEAITATATDLLTASTSEFSACIAAEAGASCPGDTNGDNVCDLADLTNVLFGFGQSGAPYANGDVNGDGVTDLADISDVLFAFGSGC
ncbi:MAG: right-handed parallel beta-helix repeat-containing protein [Phycisphaerales bacterium]|nr:right-handed parallel beta-helix repeat-containing protein [Phycisphaerales bacterium]